MVLRDSPMNLKSQADKDSCKNPAFVDNDIFEEVLSSWHVLTLPRMGSRRPGNA